MTQQNRAKLSLNTLGTTSRKSVKVSQSALIQTSHLLGTSIPLVIQPTVESMDLIAWATSNRETIEALFLQHRALLFRGFKIKSAEQFNQFVQATAQGELLSYRDRSSPRHEVEGKIYTSTDYPAQERIFLHNEGTYWLTYPLKIYFCCLTVAEQGGETPIADTQKVLQRLAPQIRDRFTEKKVLYVRNYNDGFGLTWQTVFQTDDKAVVEDYCRRNAIEFEWKPGDRLRTRQVRDAIAKHPITGELTWFNHAAFFHISTLEPTIRHALLTEFKEEELPQNTYYGDGSEIEPEVLDAIREAYHQETIIFPWQAGDILLLNNMLVAHGRRPYSGARKVLVGMAEPYCHREFNVEE
ncbi:taurine catabolism dioxygenase TauD/TfdA (plasmid) [Leptolyngbya boryana NIES-2135]|jgi:alpha-ketoglutarate-dependent taurine dioxygenase|uniref:Taurine catabolism dioxygenase TauD/TfdA n=1 Tax=Leptolyngbya boryana NIES-2135 TaxID=1973484 RepID=A0A1Z4JSU9_LEPBY|nr:MULTISPECIES: TauD/TfdA family dioxygenase [Leptolyngbya]BAY59708.1 taurine catabolism dioxygenase TauD/TfdA [Leptolyngbya boryana NIES-2135]MBD2370874.1 TauD/TfdA family dioxygenase [Leptolyngbya sp. FACHB-161]MBD2377280.1 TauD/TfdA family dioxygenase [Leptolyngbya sp. FACHB-238]MBD2401742.1 TauD/TfdA family dioxygenase [Leptolyngbya sp. FACHB-239]MBD2408209.1 TauD/TfdA family dioxygenase [Leptolyngbya sp. FACHB-402]